MNNNFSKINLEDLYEKEDKIQLEREKYIIKFF